MGEKNHLMASGENLTKFPMSMSDDRSRLCLMTVAVYV